jgi:type II secretory pathway pseudopilin PulG
MIARLRSEQGFTLVEALVSVAILTLALVVFISGLSTGVLSTSHSDRLSTAHELARSQMEYVKELPYQPAPATYATVTPTAGYTVSAAAADLPGVVSDASIQLVTVSVAKDGAPVFTLEGYRVDR